MSELTSKSKNLIMRNMTKQSLMLILVLFTYRLNAQTNTQWTTTSSIGIGTTSPSEMLEVNGNFKLNGAYGTLIRSGIFGASTNHSATYSKWIRIGEITLNGTWNDANLTLDFFPWNANHGDSRQQVNISIRNNMNSIEGSLDINLITFYGRQKSIEDVKLVHTSGTGIQNNKVSIWIQMASSHVYNVPFTAYYHGNVELVYTNQPHLAAINESGTVYDVNSRYGMTGSTFEVEGTIRSKEVKVEAAPWPDYVFEPNYDLRSLEEIEKFIQTEKHLPEIPSSSEVEDNGISIGQMSALLLKKIEELTLYTLRQEAKIKRLEEAKGQELNAKSLEEKIEELTLYLIEFKKENEKLNERIDNDDSPKPTAARRGKS